MVLLDNVFLCSLYSAYVAFLLSVIFKRHNAGHKIVLSKCLVIRFALSQHTILLLSLSMSYRSFPKMQTRHLTITSDMPNACVNRDSII